MTGRIDLHTHCIPDIYRATLAEADVHDVGGVPFPAWSIERSLSAMDTLGVSRSILSISAPGVDFGDPALAVRLAQQTNDMLIELRQARPSQFGAFATLPLPDVNAARVELRRLEGSGLEGLIILTSYHGQYLTDPAFDPLMQELSDRGLLMLLHPNVPAGAAEMKLGLAPPILEFTFDTTRLVADMIFTWWKDRFPGIRWILSHLGGALPFLSWRMSMIEHSPRGAFADFHARGKSVETYLREFHYDTAVSASARNLASLVDMVGPSRIVFGSDVPFLPFNFAQKTTAELDHAPALSDADRNLVNFGNAAGLLATGAL